MSGPELQGALDPTRLPASTPACEFYVTAHEPGPVDPPPGDGWRAVQIALAYGGAVVLWARARGAD